MKRRTFLAASAASLALPSVARAQAQTTLRYIPQADLAILDPHTTAAYVTRNHGYMVYDTLFGLDADYKPSPQMLEGHTVENDGKLWKLRLRDGLLWHDGEKVLARDCVASIKRWSKRDPFGEPLLAATDELSAPDDRTIQFRLHKKFALLPDALGKSLSQMCAMMPERLANTDPFKPVSEIIGSGPFRYLQDERLQGARNVYARFDKYRPREGGTPDWTAGPKIVHHDRVVWTTMPDNSTAAAALQTGEQDWWDFPPIDLQPLLRKNDKVKVIIQDPTGGVILMRPNHLQPPFNNPAIRRALLWGIDQTEFMQAIVGDNPDMYFVPEGTFCPRTPMASEAGLEPFKGRRDYARVKDAIKQAGYGGEKVVLMAGSDIFEMKTTAEVMADVLKRIGFNVDLVLADGASLFPRRNNKGPVDQGGWSAFITGFSGSNQLSPPVHLPVRGNGDAANSWPGWCVSPELERLRTAWFDAPDLAGQQEICRQMQLQAMQDVPYYPLGQFAEPTAHRTEIVDMLGGFSIFWNVRPG